MYETLHCVALRTVRYSDSRSILSAWTSERGYMSFAMPEGRSREAVRRRALTMPLATFEAECDIRPGREISFLKDLRAMRIDTNVNAGPAKLAVALFLAEVLDRILRNSQPDKNLTLFLFDTIDALGSAGSRGTANFVLWALYRFTEALGIAPDMSTWHSGAVFDFENGCWRDSLVGGNYGKADIEARVVRIVSRLTQQNIERMRFSRELRREALEYILRYYEMHYIKLQPLNSLAIVRELF